MEKLPSVFSVSVVAAAAMVVVVCARAIFSIKYSLQMHEMPEIHLGNHFHLHTLYTCNVQNIVTTNRCHSRAHTHTCNSPFPFL